MMLGEAQKQINRNRSPTVDAAVVVDDVVGVVVNKGRAAVAATKETVVAVAEVVVRVVATKVAVVAAAVVVQVEVDAVVVVEAEVAAAGAVRVDQSLRLSDSVGASL